MLFGNLRLRGIAMEKAQSLACFLEGETLKVIAESEQSVNTVYKWSYE